MLIGILFGLVCCFPSFVYLCFYELNTASGTITLPAYENNIECTWIWNLSSLVDSRTQFRALLLTFRHFETEFGHDELWIGETIADVSRYNSKLARFSGWKLPDPCLIPLRGDILTRAIWMQFTSDQSTTGSGFVMNYTFLVNQSTVARPKSPQVLIDAEIRHPAETEEKSSKLRYPFPYGSISSPNYPQNYSNNIICRWYFYHRNAFIRLVMDRFDLEHHYDVLTVYIGPNTNNRAMILHEWTGSDLWNRDLFIPHDRISLVFTTDSSQNASGFLLHYEVIEKDKSVVDLTEPFGTVQSTGYPLHLRTNMEYQWNIPMSDSNEIEINLLDLHLDDQNDYLQIVVGQMTYPLTRPKSVRFSAANVTTLVFRTKHARDEYGYRGFNLTYQRFSTHTEKDLSEHRSQRSPCGQTFSSPNGTIEFNEEISTSLDCLIFVEVDDGQNIYLRFDAFNWDHRENRLEIGLHHSPNRSRIFHISDIVPGSWFVANDSQLWIRFSSSDFSMGMSSFRLFFSETIQWSTQSPKADVQAVQHLRSFPFQIISSATHGVYHNLTKTRLWNIKGLDDECLTVLFRSFTAIDDRRVCFQLIDAWQTTHVCTNEQFPFTFHHVGSLRLSIEPEFIWMLVQYDVRIEKCKRKTSVQTIDFKDDHIVLAPTMPSDRCIHSEWLVSAENSSSPVIFDIENSDGNTPAELTIVEDHHRVQVYSLGSISTSRFSHVSFAIRSPIRIIYQSYALPIEHQHRSFRLHLHRVSRTYVNVADFHYIAYRENQSNSQWTIHGQNETSIFSAQIFSQNRDVRLQTTANVNLSVLDTPTDIASSEFDLRYTQTIRTDFLVVLYEQSTRTSDPSRLVTQPSGLLETSDQTTFDVQVNENLFNSLDFIIIEADRNAIIRLSDSNVNQSEQFLFNSSSHITDGLSSIIGRRFTVRSVQVRLELHSFTHHPVKLRYRARTSSIDHRRLRHCWITDVKACDKRASQLCDEQCSTTFDLISPSMNNTGLYPYLWPYALRGSVTLIVENTTIENFEKTIYRPLRQSIARIIRKFCLIDEKNCMSDDAEAIRADHVIIQSYEEELDDQRLYVALFVKDPYRHSIALTNGQVLQALEQFQEELYQDIKHQINLPSKIFEKNILDPLWLYGACLLALIVLLVVILMLMTILMKKTYRSTKKAAVNEQSNPLQSKPRGKRDSRLIPPTSVQLINEDDDRTSSTYPPDTGSSQTSNSTVLANLLPAATTLPMDTTYFRRSAPPHTSYFNSAIETAIKQRLEDDNEPIPFIDESVSVAHSRKSSAGWSDRTSLSSRFGFARRLHQMRSGSQIPRPVRPGHEDRKQKRRSHRYRTMQFTIRPQEHVQINEHL